MPTSNYTKPGGCFKASKTPQEVYLESVHGDLHEFIPEKASTMTQRRVAAALSTPELTVSQGWVSEWLRRHHYRRVVRWERQGAKS